MLAVPAVLLTAVIGHCRRDLPNEACGVLAGPAGGPPASHAPMLNAAASPHRYRMDPDEQVALWLDMDDAGLEPLIVYHSHPTGPAVPSPADVAYAAEPGAHYLIVGLAGPEPEVRAWSIADGTAVEVPITIT